MNGIVVDHRRGVGHLDVQFTLLLHDLIHRSLAVERLGFLLGRAGRPGALESRAGRVGLTSALGLGRRRENA